jgi:serine protein kinase
MELFDIYSENANQRKEEEMTLAEYLELCKTNPMAFATAQERLIDAIGEPVKLDTSTNHVLSRKFQNRTLKVYPAFSDFYGMEDTIERIVGFFNYAAQGLEEKKQVIYLLGPVGSAKSSLAERIKSLMEKNPIYVLKAGDEISPIFESPLGLFSSSRYHEELKKSFGIDKRYLASIPSPWAVKRLAEFKNDVSKFTVVKMWPNTLNQIAISKTEPGDDNNQDISSLVGKVNIRKIDMLDQNDPDAYSFSGGLCNGNQGVMEFVEMFKAPIKVLHPLLTATQEGNYNGTEEGLGAIPFTGIILAHSNESEWSSFKGDKKNEAFLDRVFIVKVPYCLSRSDEVNIYKKMLASSSLAEAPCAPKTLELLADFSVLTRLVEHENSTLPAKMRVYDGENMKDKEPKAKSMQEYKDVAGVSEGMSGMSTRFAFKILSQTFNFDNNEIGADPVHLMYVLERAIMQEQFSEDLQNKYLSIIKDYMINEYKDFISHEIQQAFLESYGDYGQAIFDKYIMYADHWVQDTDFKDPDTGQMFNREMLNNELEKIEKPAGIANPKDFRHEVVNFVLRAKANNEGKPVKWSSYENMREIIEKKMFSSTEDLLPVISYTSKGNTKDSEKHDGFIERMVSKGYTPRQCQRSVEWFLRVQKD